MMENGWQMKCGPELPSATATGTSSSGGIQLQESMNQMNMNMGHNIFPYDAQERRLIFSGKKQGSNFSNIHAENGTSFLSLLSAPPSVLQYDFQQQSNLKSSSGIYYQANSAVGNAATVSNFPQLHNSENLYSRPAVDVHPVFSSKSTMTTIGNNPSSHSLCDDLDAVRVSTTPAGSRNERNDNIYMQKGLTFAPSSSGGLNICPGTISNAVLEAPLQKPSASTKRTSAVSGCPRVFCMGACGDLLLSSTGFFGILCSCHGLHMSVSYFCEHSGLSDVNPGYAVRMDSGESIAQWRRLYLRKFGHGDERMVIFL